MVDSPSLTPEMGAKAAEEVLSEIRQALDGADLTLDYLIKKLKEELGATETKCFKSKGEEIAYSDPLIAWNIRQKARLSAHQLRGDFPSPTVEHKGTVSVLVVTKVNKPEDAGVGTGNRSGD